MEIEAMHLPPEDGKPARYAFYIDVTNAPTERAVAFLKRAKAALKGRIFKPGSSLDLRFNPLKE